MFIHVYKLKAMLFFGPTGAVWYITNHDCICLLFVPKCNLAWLGKCLFELVQDGVLTNEEYHQLIQALTE